MSFLDVNLSREVTPDLVNAPAGEYTLRSRKEGVIKEGREAPHRNYIQLVLQIEGGGPEEVDSYDGFNTVFHNVMLPSEEDDDELRDLFIRQLRECVEAFGIDYDEEGFDLLAFNGATADAILRVSEDNNGRLRNEVARFVGGA